MRPSISLPPSTCSPPPYARPARKSPTSWMRGWRNWKTPAATSITKSSCGSKPTSSKAKTKGNRAVLVELFTGAQCPPCVAADVAFDALAKTYAPGEVVLLQYHEHIPGPDALTNADSEARLDYYKRSIKGTPTVMVNGKLGPQSGGGLQHAEEPYGDLRDHIERHLDKPTPTKVQVQATRKGDKIQIKVSATGDKLGEKARLRVVLTEEWVRYRGSNRLAYHHDVVRAMPGGPQGVVLMKEHKFDIDVGELRKSLTKYLDDFQKNEGPFLDDQRPMRLDHLRVVAFVQDDDTREVLQAAQAAVKRE